MSSETATADLPSGKKLARASSIMAAGSLISRVLGLIRNMLAVALLGAGLPQGDIFSIGITIPTSIFYLVAGGALNTVLVPQIVRAIKNDRDGGEAYINRIITLVGVVLAAATALCTLAAPLLLYVYADSKWRSAQLAPYYQNLTLLAYLTMPQIFIFGVFFITGQVLNARDKFGPMMWAPIANNVVQIISLSVYLFVWGTHGTTSPPFTTTQVLVLGIGSTLACLAQTAVMLPYMRKAGIRYRPRFDFKGTGLGHTARIAKWVLLSVVVGQVVQIAMTRLASPATTGGEGAGVTIMQNATLIWMLPHGMITVSVTTALIPAISRLAAEHDLRGVRRETERSLKLVTTLIVPIAVGMALVSYSVAMVLFGWASSSGVRALGWTLFIYCFALPLYTIFYVQIRTFYAIEDTRSTFTLNNITSLTWLALAVCGTQGMAMLAPASAHQWLAPMIAGTFVVGHLVGVALSFRRLATRVPVDVAELVRHLVRLTLASLPAGLAAYGIVWLIARHHTRPLMHLLALLPAAVAGIALFFLGARLLHIDEAKAMVDLVLRRRRRVAARPGTEPRTLSPMGPEADDEELVAMPDPVEEPVTVASGAVGMPEPEPIHEADVAGPSTLPDTHADTVDEMGPVAKVTEGEVLSGRYRLERQIIRRHSVLTWEAFDLVLSRPVLVHILAPHDPRADEVLAAARRGAVATDSRFLRVLDAVHCDDDRIGSWIVCEFAPGTSIEGLLQSGPLTAVEAGWVARELADVIAPMHAQGLHHLRLNPDTVVISTTGNVKIVGFLTEAVLHPQPGEEDLDEAAREARDVESIGRLLYAMLVARWPGDDRYGLPAAPQQGDAVLTPRQVRAGISPTLDQVCDRLLSHPPVSGLPPLRTAADLTAELTRILGSADGAHDLERRMRHPVTVAATRAYQPTPSAVPSAPSAYTPVSAVSASSLVSATEDTAAVPREHEPPSSATTERFHLDDLFRDTATRRAIAADETSPAIPPVVDERPAPFTPVPAPAEAQRAMGAASATGSSVADPERESLARATSRSWTWFLVSLLALALAGGALLMWWRLNPRLFQSGPASPTPTVSATSATPAPLAALPISAARDFDPQGSGREMPARTARVFDKDPTTAWVTEIYRDATYSGKKEGVGIWVDLGTTRNVRAVTVRWRETPVSYQLMIPERVSPTAPTQLTGWTSVATVAATQTPQQTQLAQPAKARYVLVWITQLPKADNGGFQAGVTEIEVAG